MNARASAMEANPSVKSRIGIAERHGIADSPRAQTVLLDPQAAEPHVTALEQTRLATMHRAHSAELHRV